MGKRKQEEMCDECQSFGLESIIYLFPKLKSILEAKAG